MLDDFKKIEKLDRSKVYKSIESLPLQIGQSLAEASLLKVPRHYSRAKQIVVNGMGASNLGAGVIKSVFSSELRAPLIISPGYGVPAFVNKETLYILSSYSGSTEEVLGAYKQARARGAKIMAITSHGGKELEKLMIKDDIPGYIYNPEFNPSGVPRLGLGYNIFGLAALLAKAGFLKINIKEVKNLIADMEIKDRELRPSEKTNNNLAKKMALACFGKEAVFIAAEFLVGNLRVLRNQFCESGKNFASYLVLPELNHYALEGLANPKKNSDNLVFFFISSDLYHPRVKKRLELTKKIVKQNKINYLDFKLKGKSKLAQSFELLQFGTWTSYYLGILNGKDPGTNPWVDWFKKKLG